MPSGHSEQMSLTPEALYFQIGRLIAETPHFGQSESLAPDVYRWLGRAAVLVEAAGDLGDTVSFKTAAANLNAMYSRDTSVMAINVILHRALARAEMAAPTSVQNSFIPAGAELDAFSAFGRVVSETRRDVLLIDPYAAAAALTDFAVQTPEGASIRLLTDKDSVKPDLRPAAIRWSSQYGSNRPLEVRVASGRVLHDRLILIDGTSAWTFGQSLNAIAKRAPTSFIVVDAETAKLKIDAYEAIWAASSPL
jgi:hypothetical protein